jgi:hypothetical protein
MKARWTKTCECCKQEIPVGGQFVMFHGRPWKTQHLLTYQKRRRALLGKG